MSQQIGVPTPASVVESTPPSHTTAHLTTTATATATAPSAASYPPMLPGEQPSAHVDPFVKQPSDSSKTSGTITGKVEIPKLSAATTELLARVTGSIKGGAKRDGHEPDIATGLKNNNWNNTHGVANMNASAFLELPPTQFASPATAQSTTPSSVTPAPAQGNYMKSSTALINLAPKTAVPAPSRSQSQTQGTTAGATPVKRQSASSARQTASNGAKRTPKRRRRGVDDDEEGIIRAGDSSSDESDITPIATQTKSGRQVHRPSLYVPPPASSPSASNRNSTTVSNTPDNLAAGAASAAARKRKRAVRKGKEVNISCIHCQRGHSPLTNTIVFCDWCNRAWHQLCHDPCIDDEVVQVKEKEWLCKVCKPVPLLDAQPTVLRSNPNHLQSQLTRIPIETPPLEIGGAGISDDQRRGYLSSLSHATLVELLATLSERNPDLPMFPEHLKTLPSSKFSFQSSISIATSGSITSPNAASSNQELVNNGTSIIGDGENNTAEAPPAGSSLSRQKHHDLADDDDDSEYEIFEDHRLYPRAGNGLRLSLQKEDLDILREDPACPTFSYSLHGPAKDRAKANDAAPVWGTA